MPYDERARKKIVTPLEAVTKLKYRKIKAVEQ